MTERKITKLDDVEQILHFFDHGISIKDISKSSKEKLGYKLDQNTIHEILRRNNRLTMENIKKMHNVVTKQQILSQREMIILEEEEEEISEKEEIPFSNIVPPHNVYYGFPL